MIIINLLGRKNMEEYDCSLTDNNCLPHTFAGKKGEYKRVDPYLKDGKCVAHGMPNLEEDEIKKDLCDVSDENGNCVAHGMPKLNFKDSDGDEQRRQKVQHFFEGMGW